MMMIVGIRRESSTRTRCRSAACRTSGASNSESSSGESRDAAGDRCSMETFSFSSRTTLSGTLADIATGRWRQVRLEVRRGSLGSGESFVKRDTYLTAGVRRQNRSSRGSTTRDRPLHRELIHVVRSFTEEGHNMTLLVSSRGSGEVRS